MPVRIERAAAAPGKPYWKATRVEGPFEWGGRHSIFVDVLGENGRRVTEIPVLFYWDGGEELKYSEAKPSDPYSVDLPMFAAGDAYSVRIDGGLPSDRVVGMGLIAFEKHVAYKVVFQLFNAIVDGGPGPSVPPVQGKDKIQFIVNGVTIWEN